MVDINKWEPGRLLNPEEEPEYIKDFCCWLREQQTLSDPKEQGNGSFICEVVPDEMAEHAANIIEELWDRIQKLEYELREAKSA